MSYILVLCILNNKQKYSLAGDQQNSAEQDVPSLILLTDVLTVTIDC